jgi:hypothetical protein
MPILSTAQDAHSQMSESIQRRFKALPIKNALVADFSFDLGEEFSLKLFPDPVSLKLGGVCEKYALRFSCTRDVRFALEANETPMQIMSYAAKYPSGVKAGSTRNSKALMRFTLRLSTGQLEVQAEDFSLTVVQRMQIADRYIDDE